MKKRRVGIVLILVLAAGIVLGTSHSSMSKEVTNKEKEVVSFFEKGNGYLNEGKRDEAIESYTKVISLKPNDKELLSLVYNNRGYAFFLKELYDKAIEDYKKALEVYPDHERAKNNLAKGEKYFKVDKEIRAINKAITEKPEAYGKYYELAMLYLDIEKFESALQAIDKLIEKKDDDANAFSLRGYAKWKLNKDKEANKDYTRAIQLKPDDETYYYWRSFTFDRFKEREKRIADLKKALQLEPNYKDALWGLGNSIDPTDKVSNEDVKEAIDAFSKLILLDPKYDERLYKFRADLFMSLNPPDCKNAIDDMKKAVEVIPNNDWAFKYLAEDYRNCKDYDASIKTYEDIIKRNDDFYVWVGREVYSIELAKTYMLKNDIKIDNINEPSESKNKEELSKAIDYLNKALKQLQSECKEDDKDKGRYNCIKKQDALSYLGLIYEGLGQHEKALESFTRAIKIGTPLNSALKTHIALIYDDKKDYVKALENCEMSIKEKNPWKVEFGNFSCSESYIEKLKIKIANKKKDSERLAKYKRYIDLYNSTKPADLKCGYNLNEVNSVGKLSIGNDLFISYQSGLGITDVKLPLSISQNLSNTAKQKGYSIGMNMDLPFFVWFSENVLGAKEPEDAMVGLCYFTTLIKKSEFDAVQTFVSGYLDSIKKKGK